MRYGEGVSIPSQRRWVRYVEFWARQLDRKYTPGKVKVLRIQFWGMALGDGGDKIEVGIAGFVDGKHEGSKAVNKIHVFDDTEVGISQRLLTMQRTIEGKVVTYIPRIEVRTTSDVNMFLTRHRLLHESERVPRLPLSISHCWINTAMEHQKLNHGDSGYTTEVLIP